MRLGALIDAVTSTVSLVPVGQHVIVDPSPHLVYPLAKYTTMSELLPRDAGRVVFVLWCRVRPYGLPAGREGPAYR